MKPWKLDVPVALLLFNRPNTTRKVFEAVKAARPRVLFVSADGPRPDVDGEQERCAETRRILERIDWQCEVFTRLSEVNLGGYEKNSTALSWIFDTVEEAVILEDDCLPHPSFFRFAAELLERYRDDERVMVISGDNFQFGQERTPNSYYFSKICNTWGFATWRRTWRLLDLEMRTWPAFAAEDGLRSFSCDARIRRHFRALFDQMANGTRRPSWDYKLLLTCLMHHGLSVVPSVNLVSNIGFGPDAQHTTDPSNPYANLPARAMTFPLKHPPFVTPNAAADAFLLKDHYFPSLGARLIRSATYRTTRLFDRLEALIRAIPGRKEQRTHTRLGRHFEGHGAPAVPCICLGDHEIRGTPFCEKFHSLNRSSPIFWMFFHV
jgi:hypothetical protein